MANCDIKNGFCETEVLDKYSVLSLNFAKPTIVYVGDPMCSWCYGIAPQLEKLEEFAKEQNIGYEIMVGGLRPYGENWNDEFKEFLRHHWEEVSLRSKQVFDYDFLKKKSFSYSTLPSCKAVVLMRHLLKNEKLSSYFSDIQKAFFAQNQDPTNSQTLSKIAQNYGVKSEVFIQAFKSKKLNDTTFNEFSQVQNLGIRGFPSVIFFKDNKPTLIASGYATANEMTQKIKNLLG